MDPLSQPNPVTFCLPILLTATSQTREAFVLLSFCILMFSGILIEGLSKGRFLGKAIVTRSKNPAFYYLTVALLVYLIVRLSMFLSELLHAS
jgi:hypothetical protein